MCSALEPRELFSEVTGLDTCEGSEAEVLGQIHRYQTQQLQLRREGGPIRVFHRNGKMTK